MYFIYTVLYELYILSCIDCMYFALCTVYIISIELYVLCVLYVLCCVVYYIPITVLISLINIDSKGKNY